MHFPVKAELFIASDCPHCSNVLQVLTELIKAGEIAELEVQTFAADLGRQQDIQRFGIAMKPLAQKLLSCSSRTVRILSRGPFAKPFMNSIIRNPDYLTSDYPLRLRRSDHAHMFV